MFKRKIYQKLLAWKRADSRKALCIVGARQIGKTTIVRQFAADEYEWFVELNFLSDEKARKIFAGSLDAENLLLGISAFAQKCLVPGKTLILLDEVQACPEARTAVKFLVEEGSYDYIETGSLLGVNLESVKSYPVGFEEIVHMYPMDFEEFLWAMDVPENILDHLKDCYENLKPVNPVVHDRMTAFFQRYIVVGGMPDIVRTYVQESLDIAAVTEKQIQLLNLYRSDITKYAKLSNRAKILEIFNSIPSQLDDKNRRFMISQVFPRSRLQYLEDSFNWLILAGVALPCYNISVPQLPFQLNEKKSLFKLYFFDTGLLCAMALDHVQFEILQGNMDFNRGSILENVFACELAAHGFELHYYHSNQRGEVDFLVNADGKAQPVEIKSGKDFRKHRALDNILQVSGWHFGQPVVFCSSNLEMSDGVLYLPWYLSMFFVRTHSLPGKLDPIGFEDLDLL